MHGLRMRTGGALCTLAMTAAAQGAPSEGPAAPAPVAPIEAPVDRAFPGRITLAVDATDLDHRTLHVKERIDGLAGDAVLYFPKWLPGNHSSTGPIERLAGLRMRAGEATLAWRRDAVDMYAFHVTLPPGAAALDLEFDYLSPTSPRVERMEISHALMVLNWNEVVLYPAGYFARRIPVDVQLQLPAGWEDASALTVQEKAGARRSFATVDLETLVDSPLFAGRYHQRIELDPGAAAPVYLDLFGERPELIEIKPEQIEQHRALVRQAYRLFGARHYAHYDFLYAFSDQVEGKGLEHHQSSEDIDEPGTLVEWDKSVSSRDLLPHEFTHSWNGKFRRPADLWTANFNQPMQDSLLWIYEGQTDYWGQVLAARSGLVTRQQALDRLALIAARYDAQSGRRWRPLQDTTNEPILNHHRPGVWGDWVRGKEYYEEGALVWLDVDTLIRERSGDRRSLDDFARAFFGGQDGNRTVQTYTFADVVQALQAVEPYDWAAFLRARLDAVGAPAPLDGLARGGYRLVYSDKPSDLQKSADARAKRTNLWFSLGMVIGEKDSTIQAVAWDSPAFRAGLAEGTQILAVDGIAYESGVLTDAIRAAHAHAAPIELMVRNGNRYGVVAIQYAGGLRYPHLERVEGTPARLDELLAARSK